MERFNVDIDDKSKRSPSLKNKEGREMQTKELFAEMN